MGSVVFLRVWDGGGAGGGMLVTRTSCLQSSVLTTKTFKIETDRPLRPSRSESVSLGPPEGSEFKPKLSTLLGKKKKTDFTFLRSKI